MFRSGSLVPFRSTVSPRKFHPEASDGVFPFLARLLCARNSYADGRCAAGHSAAEREQRSVLAVYARNVLLAYVLSVSLFGCGGGGGGSSGSGTGQTPAPGNTPPVSGDSVAPSVPNGVAAIGGRAQVGLTWNAS